MRLLLLAIISCSSLVALPRDRVAVLPPAEKIIPELSVQDYYDKGYQQLQAQDFDDALWNFKTVIEHFSETPFYLDSLFYAGVSLFHMEHYDLADAYFGRYLNQPGSLTHFEKVFAFKFQIAQRYREGKKRHFGGIATLPRWASSSRQAIELYDEIAATLPAQELAAQALYSKANFLKDRKEFKESIEAYQLLMKRFPRHPLSAEAYVEVGDIYLTQVHSEHQNPDSIALATLNRQKFQDAFPSDERLATVDRYIHEMREVSARNLFDTGKFYEKKNKPQASKIYYIDTIARFPSTNAAREAQERLDVLALS